VITASPAENKRFFFMALGIGLLTAIFTLTVR
jgi:hypothetical protein